MGKSEALKVLERLLPSGASDAERAALRSNPEKYKEYLNALDAQYGERAKRAKDLGFSPDTFYHGTNKAFDKFDKAAQGSATGSPEKAFFVSDNPEVASEYAQFAENLSTPLAHKRKGANIIPVRIKGDTEIYPEIEQYEREFVGPAIKDSGKNNAYFPNMSDAVYNKQLEGGTVAVKDAKNIRSTNAAYDPRFKDSSDILALTGNQAPKITAKMLRPQMSLGTAFNQMNEPMEKLNEASGRNEAVKSVSDFLTKMGSHIPQQFERLFNPMFNSMTPEQRKALNVDPATHAETIEPYVNVATEIAVPASQDLVGGVAHKVMPIIKTPKGANSAQVLKEIKAAGNAGKYGATVVRDTEAVPWGKDLEVLAKQSALQNLMNRMDEKTVQQLKNIKGK